MATTDDFNGSKVALFIGDKLLITLRDDLASIPFPNMWDFPGGGREGDETPYQTLAREVHEEVSLDLPESAVLWRKPYIGAEGVEKPSWFFVARLPESAASDIALGDEGQDWQLIDPNDYFTMIDRIPSLAARLRDWMDHTR